MKILDLTLTISDKLPTFPGSPKPNFIQWENLKDDGYNLELLFLSSHTGTHLDAPYHFLENGLKIHEINPKRLIREAILIRSRKKANQAITKNDIQKFEKKYGKIPNNSTVVFWTGWQKTLHNDSYFNENPGLSEAAAKYLVSKKTNLVGIDSPSIDFKGSQRFSVHRIFSKNNILIVENLSNLEKIQSSKFYFVVLPLKLKGATGSPVRAIAFVD
jgi:kynurenine formamidase|tara:strand:+ start:106 stop:753 length:648 start_codon:yes stop_codon:yes gene_type:complete